jgi:hypothetical protein
VRGGKTWVEYTLAGGCKSRVAVETIHHVSLLSDGRGVIYIKAGGIVVVTDGLLVLEQWQQAGSRDQPRTPPPDCSK